jgi:hypothetical protein
MALKSTQSTHVTINGVSHVYAQIGDGDIYDFDEILRDTVNLSQDDNDSNDIENEVSDEPIKSIIKLGKFNFAATIEDIQADILANFMGFKKDASTGIVYAPNKYKEIYAKIVVVMPDGDKNVGYVIPHVQLNAKLILESLNSNLAGLNLQGVAKSTTMTIGDEQQKVPMFIDYNYVLPTNSTTDLAAPRVGA